MNGPHTDVQPWGHVVFWEDGAACGRDDKWTSAEVFAPRSMGMSSFAVTDPHQLIMIADFAGRVFDHGKAARSGEIAALLGIKAP